MYNIDPLWSITSKNMKFSGSHDQTETVPRELEIVFRKLKRNQRLANFLLKLRFGQVTLGL